MTEAQRRKFHRLCDEMDRQQAQSNLGSYDNMCSWLRRDHYSFYLEVRNNLSELWDEVKSNIGDFAEGALKAYASVAVTPVVAVVEGVKEGFNNGLEAGIEKAFEEGKKFLKDLWS